MDGLNIVIVGHVDHGKSTLIGRLLYDTKSLPEDKMAEVRQACEELGRDVEYAYILDNLREEREQGITIDTAQIFFSSSVRDYVIIDAPGHVEFVKNMITGASQAEAAVLLVDAVEGVQEQTRRHAYILGLLGLKQVVVAVNKMDLVGFEESRYEEVRARLLEFMGTISIKPTYVIPISAKDGDNLVKKSEKMAWYGGPSVVGALDSFTNTLISTDKPLRFPVQDVYLVGDKRVFAGRVESGIIKAGDEVTVLPNPRKTKIKSVEVYLKDVSKAEAGECIGVTTADKLFIERGNVLCAGRLPKVTDRVDAKVFWMGREPMKDGVKLLLRVATQETECTVEIRKRLNSSTLDVLGDGLLANNEVAEAVLRCDNPVVVEDFNDIPELGRFVLVEGFDVVAGGIVT